MASEGWYFRGTMQGQRGAERMAFRLQMTGLEREGLQRPGLRNKKTATPGSVIKVIAMCILQLSHLAVYMKKKEGQSYEALHRLRNDGLFRSVF